MKKEFEEFLKSAKVQSLPPIYKRYIEDVIKADEANERVCSKEACEILHVSKNTLYKLRKEGKITSFNIETKIYNIDSGKVAIYRMSFSKAELMCEFMVRATKPGSNHSKN